jgi:AcrR family transcriptional regulator
MDPSWPSAAGGAEMRDKIKAVATDLFIAHGIRGLTFIMLAERLGVPRPNVHYYYPSKQRLAEEVLDEYAAGVVALYEAVWTVGEFSLPAKFEGSMVAIRERYRRFNPPGAEGQPWGLLTRFQHERDSLTPRMEAILKDAGLRMERCGDIAVELAIEAGAEYTSRRGSLIGGQCDPLHRHVDNPGKSLQPRRGTLPRGPKHVGEGLRNGQVPPGCRENRCMFGGRLGRPTRLAPAFRHWWATVIWPSA